MTAEPCETSAGASTSCAANPPGAFRAFLGLTAAGYIALVAFVVAYGLYGDALTSGVDDACAEAAFQNGEKMAALGNYDLAIQRFRQALEGRFLSKERKYTCARSIGETLLLLGRYEEAIDAYRSMPAEAFSAPGHWAGYVSALYRAGQPQEAERLGKVWLASATAADDQRQTVWANATLGHICEDIARLEEALNHYRAAETLEPENQAGVMVAVVLQKQGKTDEAVRQLDAFLARVPSGQLHEDAKKLRTQFENR
jgi:tetratricopeptide (TPR) repeat protein